MFEIPKKKNFMDTIHGYISIPQCFIDHIIDTVYFQRLRNIEQTGMRVLFPNAKHDRFSHSLGVFYLGQKAVDALLSNFRANNYWNIASDNSKVIFWSKNKVLFLIACLLHDIGHAPFSHSLEELLFDKSANPTGEKKLLEAKIDYTKKIASKINELEQSDDDEEVKYGDIQATPHEQLGAMLVLDHFRSNIDNIFDDLIKLQYPNVDNGGILYAEHYNGKITINKDNFDKDMAFIARMILGLKYKSYTPELQIRNCFIELLNGGNFDVDKLDYIVRDTQMSGISNVSIDVERLLTSLCIITKTRYKNKKFENKSLPKITVSHIQNLSAGKIRIRGHLKGVLHILPNTKVNIFSCSALISMCGEGENRDARIEFIGNITAKFTNESMVFVDGQEMQANDENQKIINKNQNNSFSCRVENAQVVNRFEFAVLDHGVNLTIDGLCNLEITGEFIANNSVELMDGTLDGEIAEIEILSNGFDIETTRNKLPNPNAYNTFSIGFNKQAINIIANVLEARNYLYLWVYAHHKVVYCSNYLLDALVNKIFAKGTKYKELKNAFHYNDIALIDDAYVWTIIKDYYIRNKDKTNEIVSLCCELLERKYKRSMYKSLAEFDRFFDRFNSENKKIICMELFKTIDSSLPFSKFDSGEYSGGYITKVLKELKRLDQINLTKIKNLVIVKAGYKINHLEDSKTFLIFKNETITTSQIPMLKNNRDISEQQMSYYFYLYYSTENTNEEELDKEYEYLKDAFLKYCQRLVDK